MPPLTAGHGNRHRCPGDIHPQTCLSNLHREHQNYLRLCVCKCVTPKTQLVSGNSTDKPLTSHVGNQRTTGQSRGNPHMTQEATELALSFRFFKIIEQCSPTVLSKYIVSIYSCNRIWKAQQRNDFPHITH